MTAIPPDSQLALLRDALEHIAKVAALARTQTDRIAFIEARARTALAGDRWDGRYVKYPKQSTKRHLVRQLLLVTEGRTHQRDIVIGWLREGYVPPAPEIDPVEQANHVWDEAMS